MQRITINRHLGNQNNNKSTFRRPFSSHTPMNRHLRNTYISNKSTYNNKSTFTANLPMNRHLGNTFITINRQLCD